MASHLTVSLLPSSTIIGFFIGFNFGAAARKRKRENMSVWSSSGELDDCLFTSHVCFRISVRGGTRQRRERAETGDHLCGPRQQVPLL